MSVQVSVRVKNQNIFDKMIRRLPLLPIFIAQQVTVFAADRLELTTREASPVWRGTLKGSIDQSVNKTTNGADALIFSDSPYLENIHEGYIPDTSLRSDPGKIVQLAQWRSDKAKNIPLNRLIHSLSTYGIKNPKPFFSASFDRFAAEQGIFRAITIIAIKRAIAKL